ncbi:MAG: ABC transporter permease [Bryobacterales bacterium]|nr:ABC transporter permease [Bryobacterales bacterium]
MFGLAVWTLWRRELVRFWREKARVLGFVGSPLVFWLLIGSGFGDLRFFFPGALALTVMFSAIFSTMSLIEDRREGFLLSMLVSPAPRHALVLGKTLGSATLAWIQGVLFLAFAPLAGIPVSVGSLAATGGVIFLMALTLTLLGFWLAWRLESTQGFHAVINLVLVPLWMVSGSLFSMEQAHGWIRAIMRVNPLTYEMAALRQVLDPMGTPPQPGLRLSLTVTLVYALTLLALATLSVRRRPGRSTA